MDYFSIIQNKILNAENLQNKIIEWRKDKKKIVFTNGCFDILHRGHIEYLAKAASFGDIMILGLNNDRSVKSIKGPERPIQDERSRSLVLASLQFVSAVTLFAEDTPYELIKKVQPDYLVKGADYKPKDIVGYDILMSYGGQVKTVELVEGHSTTGIINKLR